MAIREPQLGDSLYNEILPALYRTRDASGDLRAFLDAGGDLLDAMFRTLEQRHADAFPDQPPAGSALEPCQEWLLPYFADLFDVELVSPLADGRRDEIGNAVLWRQGKGTLTVIEQVLEAITQHEAVIHEGWQRVAITPHLGRPLQPAITLGYAREPLTANPGSAARHPDLPAATVDFRCPATAVRTTESNPGAQAITVDGVRHLWRQASVHGVPCDPDSYADPSARTVDVRTPGVASGRYHPRRVIAYLPVDDGFATPDAVNVNWTEPPNARFLRFVEIDASEPGRTVYRNRTLGGDAPVPVTIQRRVELGTPPGHAGNPDVHTWVFEDLIIAGSVEAFAGRMTFLRCAVNNLISHAIDSAAPTIVAQDCAIQDLDNPRGVSRLEFCTLVEECLSEVVEASDCIFLGRIRQDRPTSVPPDAGCVRYSRVIPTQEAGGMALSNVTRTRVEMYSTQFRDRHYAVLRPENTAAILAGAEDGGELGAFHHRYHAVVRRAVGRKLQQFLPVGIELVLVADPQLLKAPVAI